MRNIIRNTTTRFGVLAGALGMATVLTMGTAHASTDASHSPVTTVSNDPAEASASGWAQNQMSSTNWDGLCLQFVSDAYNQAGVSLAGEAGTDDSAIDYWNTYTGTKYGSGSDQAPTGALIFWGATSTNPYGHVAMSLGNGEAISSDERDNTGVHIFNVDARDAAGYQDLGYVIPA